MLRPQPGEAGVGEQVALRCGARGVGPYSAVGWGEPRRGEGGSDCAEARQERGCRNVEGLGDRDEVVDVTSALGALDAGQHGVGHRVAEGCHAVGQLPL